MVSYNLNNREARHAASFIFGVYRNVAREAAKGELLKTKLSSLRHNINIAIVRISGRTFYLHVSTIDELE
jgi:hypothetical protein